MVPGAFIAPPVPKVQRHFHAFGLYRGACGEGPFAIMFGVTASAVCRSQPAPPATQRQGQASGGEIDHGTQQTQTALRRAYEVGRTLPRLGAARQRPAKMPYARRGRVSGRWAATLPGD